MQMQMIAKVQQTKTETTATQGMAKEVLRPTEEQQAARIPKTGSSLAERACARGYSREESVAPTVSSDLSGRNRVPITIIRCGDRADVAFACS